jgi:CRISPR-associated protein Cas2
MENYGIRVQKSVFEMYASNKTLRKLRAEVSNIIKNEDYVIYFRICEKDWQKKEKFGKKVFVEDIKNFEIY